MASQGNGGKLRKRKGKVNKDGGTKEDEEVEPLLVAENKQEAAEVANPSTSEDQHDDGYILTPLIERSLLSRLDVGPFLMAYLLLICLDYRQASKGERDYSTGLLQPTTLGFATLLVIHLMLVLMQQWNIQARSLVGYRKGSQTLKGDSKSPDLARAVALISSWTHCLVQEASVPINESAESPSSKKPSAGISTMAGISPVEVRTEKNGREVATVKFHDIVFRCPMVPTSADQDLAIWEPQADTTKSNGPRKEFSFHRVRFPIDLPLSFYEKWKGHSSLESVMQCQQLYGSNAAVLELPTFPELLSEQVVAPFFLFQMFCVALWSLDEYWYYAIFTLFALLSFESTVAYNRLQSLQRLRDASRQNNQKLWVFRKGFVPKSGKSTSASPWLKITAQEIVPGDIVSLTSEVDASNRNGGRSGSNKKSQHNSVPADIVVLQGNAVVDEALLTGESIPQLKVALDSTTSANDATERLDIQEHKESMLFGGTVLLTANNNSDEDNATHSLRKSEEDSSIPSPPDEGVVGMVLRTGFETAQGSLLRTIAHSSKSVDGVHTKDTFVFIFLLLCCAFASASLVLRDGWEDHTRNRFRLVLHVIIIITSVVPPELPMELSLAVTNSVADLMKHCQVYCTEHFRISWAGSVDVCCFDKTGTLTSDQMRLKGVRLFDNDDLDVLDEESALVSPTGDDPEALPWTTLRVMAACHSLALNRGKGASGPQIIGDPLEQAVLKDTGYQLVGNNMMIPSGKLHPSHPKSITILHRFAFASRLKRMTSLVTEEESAEWDSTKTGTIWALTKGAPETIRELIKPDSLPADYDEISTYHMSRGRRVLAMGYRSLGFAYSVKALKDEGREKVEKDLTFAGFLVLDCPLKSDSKSVISELKKSAHNVIMITGDAVLTAAEVARQVGIIPTAEDNNKHVTYWLQEQSASVETNSNDPLSRFSFVQLNPKRISRKETALTLSGNMENLHSMVRSGRASFCLTGDMLTRVAKAAFSQDDKSNGVDDTVKSASSATANEKSFLLHPKAQSIMQELVTVVSVFARHAPHQKEAVVAAFNLSGHYTCMVGDGTNDVGALKRAHVGISIISAPEAESKQLRANSTLSRLKKERKAQKKERKAGSISTSQNHSMEESLRLLHEAQEEIDQVELGDASVASPFTSRQVSITCCKNVLQQGRCTLVTMLQIYKILGINCLVNAMVLSTLFLHGVKQGDRQLTVLGIVVAALFLFVTRGKPLSTLSAVRPPASVLCPHTLLSIALQFAIHFGTILVATNAALSFVDPYDPSTIPDGPFNPNVLNTCTFMLTVLSTINTFAVNYRGRPFMEDLRENKLLVRSLLACYASLFLCAYEAFPPLNDLLQLSSFPSTTVAVNVSVIEDDWLASVMDNGNILSAIVRTLGFPTFMVFLMAIDTLLSFSAEMAILRFFESH